MSAVVTTTAIETDSFHIPVREKISILTLQQKRRPYSIAEWHSRVNNDDAWTKQNMFTDLVHAKNASTIVCLLFSTADMV